MELLDLYCKPVSHSYTDQERRRIAAHFVRNPKMVYYALYNKHSYKGMYFVVIIDSQPGSVRKSPLMNNWDIICKRKLVQEEIEEQITNFGCNNRRFTVWYYKDIEQLILDDEAYGVVTPLAFVKAANQFKTQLEQ